VSFDVAGRIGLRAKKKMMKEQDPRKAESHEMACNNHASVISRRKMRSTNR